MKERWTAFWLRARQWAGRCRDRIVEWLGRARYRVAEPKETCVVDSGFVYDATDERRPVEFRGQRLAQHIYAEGDRRITETLYHVGYRRYLVHTRTLSRAKGLPTTYSLREVNEGDLNIQYSALARLRLPLQLAEVIRT